MGYAYDPDGALQTQTNPNGTVAAYTDDNARRLTEVWNKPSASSTDVITRHQFTMDAVGNLTALIDANGQVTRYLYDERDSLKEVRESPASWTDPDSPPSPTYVTAYEVACPDKGGAHLGNLTRVKRDSGGSAERVVDYAYDGLNRVRKETQYAGPGVLDTPLVMTTTYDANNNRATVTDPLSRTTTYAYDCLNRLTIIEGTSAASLILEPPGHSRTEAQDSAAAAP